MKALLNTDHTEVLQVFRSLPKNMRSKYPAQILTKWTDEELAAIHIFNYVDGNSINNRYYDTSNPTYTIDAVNYIVTGTYTGTDRDITELKQSMVDKVLSACATLCKKYDWMNHRESDGGTAFPQNIKDYRNAVRAENNIKEAEINAMTTMSELIAYENTAFTGTHYVQHVDSIDSTITYGPETIVIPRNIDLCIHYDAIDPNVEVDPSFVSLIKD